MQQEYARLRRCGTGEATTSILGAPLRLSNAASFEGMHREIFVREIFRFDAACPTPRILDCGAHVGMASIYLGRRHPGARITAFEADPRIAAMARTNLDAFGLERVEVVAAAVADHDGTATFSSTGNLSGRVDHHNSLPTQATCVVPAVRLARYLEEPVEFLKIDIEGAESDALHNAADRLRNVRMLFVEYHGFAAEEQRLPEFLRLLSDAGFRYYATSAHDIRRCPLNDRNVHYGMDLQLNIFCVRSPP